ncbi:hypothetical protein IAT40_007715 [Kwoniella sp. CBS 6097]
MQNAKTHKIPDSEFGTLTTRTQSISSRAAINKSDDRTLAQPHFAEQALSIRRLSINPFLPDEITRVNSISSTLMTNSQPTSLPDPSSHGCYIHEPDCPSAQTSSDILPHGGGRKGSHASSAQPRLLGSTGLEANSLKSNVVAVGDRRPSVLSGGLAAGADTDKLSIRKISIGGWEDQAEVQAAGIDPSSLPVRMLPSFYAHNYHQHEPSRSSRSDSQMFPPPKLNIDREPVESPVPSPHPFSSTSIRRSSFMAEPTIAFPVPRIRMSQISIPPVAHVQQKSSKPESLDLDGSLRGRTPTSGVKDKGDDEGWRPIRQVSLALPTNGSMRALKSAPLYSAVPSSSGHIRESHSSFGYGSDLERGIALGSSEEGGMFGDWRGFPLKTWDTYHTAHENHSGPEIGFTVSPATPYQPGTPAQALAQLDGCQRPGVSLRTRTEGVIDGGLNVDWANASPDDKRSSTSSKTSRITYLADVVKEEEEQKRQSLLSASSSTTTASPDQRKPPAPLPEAHIGLGRPKSQLSGDRPPSLSPLGMEQGLGLNFALAPGMGVGIAFGLGPGKETKGARRQSQGGDPDDGLPRVL